MQPYQEAAREIGRQGEIPLNIAKNVATIGSTAATAYLGGNVLNRVIPFLSKYIPQDLAIKGLNKIDPRYGKFIQKALSSGKSFDEVKDFIGSKIEESGEKPKENRNIIEQYSPELHQFISEHVKTGRKPIEAGALAQNDKRFSQIINKLSKDHNTPWSNILESVYGGQGQSQNPMQQSKSSSASGQQSQQPGQGQQALMQMLEKINQRLGQ